MSRKAGTASFYGTNRLADCYFAYCGAKTAYMPWKEKGKAAKRMKELRFG